MSYAMFSVRGMGVAERVRVSTCLAISLRRSLWVTPNRCSSSMTRSPRFLNCTDFCSSLWVPISTSTPPVRTASKIRFCSFGAVNRDRTSTFTGNPAKRLMNPKNAAELLAQPDIDGGLIGGAALKPEQFVEIINAANQD